MLSDLHIQDRLSAIAHEHGGIAIIFTNGSNFFRCGKVSGAPQETSGRSNEISNGLLGISEAKIDRMLKLLKTYAEDTATC